MNLLNLFNGDGQGGGFPTERGAKTPEALRAQVARHVAQDRVRSRGRVLQRDAAGRPRRLIGTVQDLTAARQAQRQLRESEERYRALFSNMLDAFALHAMVLDEKGNAVDYIFLSINPVSSLQTKISSSIYFNE